MIGCEARPVAVFQILQDTLGPVLQRLQHRGGVGFLVDLLLQPAHEVEHLAFVRAALAAKPFQGLHIEGYCLSQPAEALLRGTLFHQTSSLVGEISHVADAIGISIAHRCVELCKPLERRNVIEHRTRLSVMSVNRG